MSKKEEIVKAESVEVVPYQAPDVGELMKLAIDKNISVESLEKLVTLNERVADRAAAQEFNHALAAFQRECPPIKKESTAKIATRGGSSYSYTFADLDTIVRTVRPIAFKHGLSWTWDSDSTTDKNVLTCVCVLRHENGHQIRAAFSCPTDSASAMSAQQKQASALTYARRQSLVQVLGLTTTDSDFDGGVVEELDETPISENEAADLDTMMHDTDSDPDKFCRYFGVKSVAELPKRRLKEAVQMLAKKARK